MILEQSLTFKKENEDRIDHSTSNNAGAISDF